ncbi:MAG TPA: bifunctional riboflavin kinase/FAD synthetase [Quisquiliibacterium sp.]|nr:bifunctional riboflavin kinase/FAD synthetase [Quisquiliibacterium sp.]HPA90750.1 bifunctional riboflavin kinase/FAD synthetase [Quisquiliibacterium sp.]HQD84317.1 bifunctional riboflavin kinase/FAD synthetase [Quisquiliibacterium sp.]HQN12909.1 bifunctional riboflavin kinase/FAD synthetase [Quisquiliibacterium sp.]HQP68564.1 bifunctional riboflavin kinase/FAD synthetase [Quisquiliibacterium sp.]
MDVFRRLPPADQRQPCALTIGNFDGVHLGHQAVLQELRAQADRRGLPTCVLTFEPHPREYFAALHRSTAEGGHADAAAGAAGSAPAEAPGAAMAGSPGAAATQAPPRILTERDKLDALSRYGVDRVCIAHFNASVAALPAATFVDEVIVEGMQARFLLIGDDFRFGAKRQGSFETLRALGPQRGFELAQMATIRRDGARISSSAVRTALATGDFALAESLLGRPYFISGHVVHGRKLGRTLGFPTLNIRLNFDHPAVAGVFVVQVHGVADRPWPAVASLGTRPAVERNGKLLLEVHLFDFSGDLYGKLVRVEFLQRLREERHYDSLEALTAQIDLDARQARGFFQRRGQ